MCWPFILFAFNLCIRPTTLFLCKYYYLDKQLKWSTFNIISPFFLYDCLKVYIIEISSEGNLQKKCFPTNGFIFNFFMFLWIFVKMLFLLTNENKKQAQIGENALQNTL